MYGPKKLILPISQVWRYCYDNQYKGYVGTDMTVTFKRCLGYNPAGDTGLKRQVSEAANEEMPPVLL